MSPANIPGSSVFKHGETQRMQEQDGALSVPRACDLSMCEKFSPSKRSAIENLRLPKASDG
jgi:hypothetical protein